MSHVNILRMAVGIDSLEHLRQVLDRRAQSGADGRIVVITTRFTPRRLDEVLGGGSMYWIVKRYVRARAPILDIRPFTSESGKSRCAFVISPDLIATEPQRRRAQQGWRYLDVRDAPPDLPDRGASRRLAEAANLPPEMLAELRELALL